MLEFGGDDQWSNMLGGTELIRRKLGKDAYAMTITLLTDSNGMKMGKTAGNAVWLDANKTSPFDFYQYWRNVGDADVMKCLKMLTFIPLEQLKEMEKWDDSRINEKKMILAHELTEMVHGKEEADKAEAAAKALFSGEGNDANMPTTELENVPEEGLPLLDAMVSANLITSKGEGRRLIEQGGVSVNNEKVTDVYMVLTKEMLKEGAKIKKGKKVFHKVVVK